MQSSISLMSSHGGEKGRWLMERIKFGSSLKFLPGRISRSLVEGDGLDEVRKKDRVGVRAPRLALVSFWFLFETTCVRVTDYSYQYLAYAT